jgi:hypothetical protein
MSQTIDLESVRARLCLQLERELNATVTGSVYERRMRHGIEEVTFDLWIERCGTRINRRLFVAIRPQLWCDKTWSRLVHEFVDGFIRKDLVKQQSKDFLAKAAMN